jgi:arylsulfatase A-like enzyme
VTAALVALLLLRLGNVLDATGATSPPALAAAPLARDYNVVLVSIDSLRADHLGAYGYPRATSPTIDALADGGVLCRKTSATTAWTLPSHMSILTGRSLLGHGVVTDDLQLGDDVPTLAESFKAAGYTTGAIVSAPYVEARYGFGRGFDEYDDHTIRFATHGESYKNVTAPLVESTARTWLTRHAGGKFFLFLHWWDVHYDYAPGAPYDKMFDPDYEGKIDGVNFYFNPKVNADMDRRDLAHVVALYDGEIRLVDDHLAKLRAALAELGVAERTIIVVTADHGDEFFEHGRKGHHRTLYEEIIHVPLVLYVPGVQPRRNEIAMPTSTVDIMPTLLGLTGLEKPAGLDGADLSGIAFGNEAEWDRETIAELYRTESLNVQVSLQREGRKVIHHFNDRLIEAYDTATDPNEVAQLDTQEGFAPGLLAELATWLNDKWTAHRGRERAGLEEELPMDAETEDRLRALGYIE